MMRMLAVCILGFSVVGGGSSYATSLGRIGQGEIRLIENKPAICLPAQAKNSFPVGWITLSDSYDGRVGSWALVLESGEKPLVLKPGECVTYGSIPVGYKIEVHGKSAEKLELRAKRTYDFELRHSIHSTYAYEVKFCIEEVNGVQKYHPYTWLPKGGEVIPSCDAKLNGNVPEPSPHVEGTCQCFSS